MDWLNLPGLMMVVALLAPNLLYALKRHGSLRRRGQESRLWTALEQLGRFGCMALMCVRLPLWHAGFASAAAQTVWLSLTMVLLAAYVLLWVFYFHRAGSKALAVLLAAIPSALFLLSGFLWRSFPLTLLAMLFTVAHIRVTWVNLAHTEA